MFTTTDSNQMASPQSYLGQIPDILQKYYQPYSQMLDPTTLMSKFGAQYTKDPGYQFELGEGERAIGSAAAAGGMAGSPQQQQQAGTLAENLANQYYSNYLNRALGIFGQGAGGYSQLGQSLASNLMSESSLAQLQKEEQERQQEEAARRSQEMWGDIGQLGGQAIGMLQYL
jgi:hypothetical protein